MLVKRKLPLTLIEVSIALGIMAIVIFVLFSSFHQSTKLMAKIDLERTSVAERDLLFQRLNQIFTHIQPKSIQIESPTDAPAECNLLFQFENGLDPSMTLSGDVRGHILLDQSDTLMLQITPISTSNQSEQTLLREEPLLRSVEAVLWEEHPRYLVLTITHKSGREDCYPFFLPHDEIGGFILKEEER